MDTQTRNPTTTETNEARNETPTNQQPPSSIEKLLAEADPQIGPAQVVVMERLHCSDA